MKKEKHDVKIKEYKGLSKGILDGSYLDGDEEPATASDGDKKFP